MNLISGYKVNKAQDVVVKSVRICKFKNDNSIKILVKVYSNQNITLT